MNSNFIEIIQNDDGDPKIFKSKKCVHVTDLCFVVAQAQEVLVKQMNCRDTAVVRSVMLQLRSSPVWKYRADAAKLLSLLGNALKLV